MEYVVSAQMTVTRMIRARELVNGSMFLDPFKPEKGACVVLDVEIHDDHVTAIIVTPSGEQIAFARAGWCFVTLEIQA